MLRFFLFSLIVVCFMHNSQAIESGPIYGILAGQGSIKNNTVSYTHDFVLSYHDHANKKAQQLSSAQLVHLSKTHHLYLFPLNFKHLSQKSFSIGKATLQNKQLDIKLTNAWIPNQKNGPLDFLFLLSPSHPTSNRDAFIYAATGRAQRDNNKIKLTLFSPHFQLLSIEKQKKPTIRKSNKKEVMRAFSNNKSEPTGTVQLHLSGNRHTYVLVAKVNTSELENDAIILQPISMHMNNTTTQTGGLDFVGSESMNLLDDTHVHDIAIFVDGSPWDAPTGGF